VATVGIIANPNAGKDVRRLVAHATVTSDATKVSIIRRVAIGAVEAGADKVVVMPDRQQLGRRALDGLDVEWTELLTPLTDSRHDSGVAAAAMAALGVGCLVVLGGDGTCRDVARAWPDAPLLPLSTGTNNVFPIWVEATVAGSAAGLVAGGAVELEAVATRAKVVLIGGKGEADGPDDLALVDAALLDGGVTGSRALWDPDRIRSIVATRAEPAAVGLSGVAGLLAPVGAGEPGGVLVRCAPSASRRLRAPLAPGLFADFGVVEVRRLGDGETVRLDGPGVLAVDGERDRVLHDGDAVTARIERQGPMVVDPAAALRRAAVDGHYLHHR
jgi:hypothetical protein